MIFEGWQNRSQGSDIMAEKGSDAMLGLERVYDPSTNQVYEVPAGWVGEMRRAFVSPENPRQSRYDKLVG